jgi:hypothetical protein
VPRICRIFALLAALGAVAGLSAAPASARPFFGYNDGAVRAGLVSADRDAALTQVAGADITRLTFDWRWVEPTPGNVRLGAYDQIYRSMTARGIRPLFVLAFAPHWTWSASVRCNQWTQECRYPPDPSHYADWRRIVETIATRYPNAAGIEVWNEENASLFWRPAPDAVAYAELLKQTKAAVNAVRPSLPVITGGLGTYDVTTGQVISVRDFLNTIYARAGKDAFDGLGVHGYPTSLYNGPGSGLAKGLDRYRTSRALNGDASKPLWFTEGGYRTGSSGPWTEAQQAQGNASLYSALASQRDVRAVVVHSLVDGAGYGVLRSNLSLRPAYCALSALRGLPCGSQQPGTPAVTGGRTPPRAVSTKEPPRTAHGKRSRQDVDGDGIPNKRDRDVDGDGLRNGCQDRDIDGDGRRNIRDRNMDGDGQRNRRDRDMDGDGIRNRKDADMDGDCRVRRKQGRPRTR